MSLLARPFFTGLGLGLVTAPIIAAVYVKPKWTIEKFDEVSDIRHEIDHLGWHIRHLQEESGFGENDLYTPATYFQDLY